MYLIFSYLILECGLDKVVIPQTIFIEWEREPKNDVFKNADEKRTVSL